MLINKPNAKQKQRSESKQCDGSSNGGRADAHTRAPDRHSDGSI